MLLSKVIKQLLKEYSKHGDVPCTIKSTNELTDGEIQTVIFRNTKDGSHPKCIILAVTEREAEYE